MWFAFDEYWAIFYEAKEKPEEPEIIVPEENEIEEFEKEIQRLEAKILLLEKQIENMPEEIFICKKTGKYKIHLNAGETLYIK